MDSKILEKVNQQIYTQFPYLNNVVPNVEEMPVGTFELRYQGSVQTANGMSLPVVVKVITDAQGRIQKLVTSR